jgi:UDP-N-acetylglucosamine 1-carboxyvinyltransferase
MERFVVRSSGRLSGAVRIGGAKNSILKCMAACLLAEGVHRLERVPAISDVDAMAEILVHLGAQVEWVGPTALEIRVPAELGSEVPADLAERMRASVVLLGPLLARTGRVRLPMPGGDDFGQRPIDFHLRGLASMGAAIDVVGGAVVGRVSDRLRGAHLSLEFASHTSTDNLLMAAVLARGETVIENAAREPEVVDLVAMLSSMGARIGGAGTCRLTVEGVDALAPAHHVVIPDRVEAATYLAAVGVALGEVHLVGARADHMTSLLGKYRQMGLEIEPVADGLVAGATRRLRSVDVATLPYPGVATDYKPAIVVALALAEGTGIVTENLFLDSRFGYVAELRRMGADIRLERRYAVVRGVSHLVGRSVRGRDLRAGAALVLAGLAADGETEVFGVEHVDRGYEDLAGKLRALGADVSREPVEVVAGVAGSVAGR